MSAKILADLMAECQIVSTLSHRVLKVKEGQSQRSKMVKPSGTVGFGRRPSRHRSVPILGLFTALASWNFRAGKLEAASWATSWQAGLQELDRRAGTKNLTQV